MMISKQNWLYFIHSELLKGVFLHHLFLEIYIKVLFGEVFVRSYLH